MTIGAYEALYESTIAYGIRKALMAEQMKTELEAKINQLNGTKRELNEQVENLKKTIDNTISRANEKRAQEEKAHNDEVWAVELISYPAELLILLRLSQVERIQKTNEQLRSSLETMLAAPKK